MAHDVLHDCPVCHKPLHITKLHCPACGTSIEGDFQAERLLALTPEQRSFVLSFLRNRGNIREMEKELGISYPPCARGWTRSLPRWGWRRTPARKSRRAKRCWRCSRRAKSRRNRRWTC